MDFVHELENTPPMSDRTYANGGSPTSTKKMTNKHKALGKLDGKFRVDKINRPLLGRPLKLKRLQPKKKKVMGSPIIVEDIEDIHSSPSLPSSLKHTLNEVPSPSAVSLGPFRLGKKKSRDRTLNRAKITIAESIDPNPSQNQKRLKKSQSTPPTSPTKAEPEASQNLNLTRPREIIEDLTEFERTFEEEFTGENSPLESQQSSEPSEVKTLDEAELKKLPRFYSIKNKVLAILDPEDKFSFHGKLRIRVLYGAVKIYGFLLNPSTTRVPLEIYSPRAYSAIAIEATESDVRDRDIKSIWTTLAESDFDRELVDRFRDDTHDLEDGWAIIELQDFENNLTNFLLNWCPHRLFPRVADHSNHSWRDARRAEVVLQANLRSIDPCKQLAIGSRGVDDLADGICYDWDTKFSCRTVIAGGKGVGKSTTARYIVNKLLGHTKAVAFMDLDPGQAEFTPAGCISLSIIDKPILGPNFTHLRTPYHQIYIGTSDVTRSLTCYVDGIERLVERANKDPKLVNLPLVVNTMGFCKGIGWDIISYTIKIVAPTDVVQIVSKRSKNNFDDNLSRQVIDLQQLDWISWAKDSKNREKPARHRLHEIYSEAETGSGSIEAWNLEAHQQRDLVMLAYLSRIVCIQSSSDRLLANQTPNINAVPPYVVPFSSMSVALAGAFIPQILSVMNGNIVAMCGIDDESTRESKDVENVNVSYPRVLVRPPLATCYGFGILRGVDMENKNLYLNTPIPRARLQHVNCLIGSVNVPSSLLQTDLENSPYTYTGGDYDLPTSREPRRGYFRTRHIDI